MMLDAMFVVDDKRLAQPLLASNGLQTFIFTWGGHHQIMCHMVISLAETDLQSDDDGERKRVSISHFKPLGLGQLLGLLQ